MADTISVGAIKRLCDSGGRDKPANLILQVLQIKPLLSNGSAEQRYRIILSDTNYYIQTILSTHLNHLVTSGQMVKYCIINITQLANSELSGRNPMLFRIDELFVIPNTKGLSRLGETSLYKPEGEANGDKQSYNSAPSRANQDQNSNANAHSYANPQNNEQRDENLGNNADDITQISDLSPYRLNWKIKARVVNKSEVKQWSNQKGQGKLFSLTLMDESAEIRVVGFGAEVDAFYDVFQEGKAYYISNGKIGFSKKDFTTVPHDYQIQLERVSEVTPCTDEYEYPKIKYNFVKLQNLDNVEKDGICDVLGIVTDVGDVAQITSKTTNKAVTKRSVSIVDDSGYTTNITLWGKQAENCRLQVGEVIAVKGAKVSDFNGRSLSILTTSLLEESPTMTEAYALLGWYNQKGKLPKFEDHNSLSKSRNDENKSPEPTDMIVLKDLEESGEVIKEAYYDFKGTIILIKSDKASYPACTQCHKKLVLDHDGTGQCDNCNTSNAKPTYRYLLLINVGDPTYTGWFTAFDDVGKHIMHVDADTLQRMKDEDPEEYEKQFNLARLKTYNLHCRTRTESYNGKNMVRNTILSAKPINYVAQSKRLLEHINSYLGK